MNHPDPLAAVIAEIVSDLLEQTDVLTPLDVLLALEIIDDEQLATWRRGGSPYLERGITKGLARVARILHLLREEALRRGLTPSPGRYLVKGSKRKRLRFSKRGDPESELAYSTHFIKSATAHS